MIALTFATEQFVLSERRERVWYTNLTHDAKAKPQGIWSRMCFDNMVFDVVLMSQYRTELNKSIRLSDRMSVFSGVPYLHETKKVTYKRFSCL